MRGGKRPGAGRKRGSGGGGKATTKTREIANKAAAEGLTPLEYLLAVLRNPKAEPHARLDAAKAAAPYVHPRLAPIEPQRKLDDVVPLAERVKEYTRRDAIEASAGKVVDLQRARGA